MRCGNCGAHVTEGSRFCNVCGKTLATASVMTAPPNRAPVPHGEDVPEHVIFSVRPSFLFVGVRYIVAAVIWIAAAAIIAALGSLLGVPAGAGAVVVVVVGALLFVNPIIAHVRRQRQLYTLTSHKLEIQHGIFATTVRNIPLSKVQDVTVSSTITQRILGLGNILIDNASESEGRLVIGNVHDAKRYADRLLAELRRWN